MEMRDRLIELIGQSSMWDLKSQPMLVEQIANYLLANGVIVTPCVAMVEQFIKDGKFDKKHTAHNGRFAVVYKDMSKSSYALVDITEQFYNTEKANERIQALKEREGNG